MFTVSAATLTAIAPVCLCPRGSMSSAPLTHPEIPVVGFVSCPFLKRPVHNQLGVIYAMRWGCHARLCHARNNRTPRDSGAEVIKTKPPAFCFFGFVLFFVLPPALLSLSLSRQQGRDAVPTSRLGWHIKTAGGDFRSGRRAPHPRPW